VTRVPILVRWKETGRGRVNPDFPPLSLPLHPPPRGGRGRGEIGHKPEKHAFQVGFTTCLGVLRFFNPLPSPSPPWGRVEGEGEIGHKPQKHAFQVE